MIRWCEDSEEVEDEFVCFSCDGNFVSYQQEKGQNCWRGVEGAMRHSTDVGTYIFAIGRERKNTSVVGETRKYINWIVSRAQHKNVSHISHYIMLKSSSTCFSLSFNFIFIFYRAFCFVSSFFLCWYRRNINSPPINMIRRRSGTEYCHRRRSSSSSSFVLAALLMYIAYDEEIQ